MRPSASPRTLLAAAALLAPLALAAPARAAGRCEDLAGLKLADTAIVSAAAIPAGGYVGPDGGRRADLPAFCRVSAVVRGAPDSEIKVEVWLPADGWTGVFHGAGAGGYAGSVQAGYPAMEAGLRRGYAAATTDMGTAPATSLNADALLGHPQKWADWGGRSTHVMTVTGKAIAKAYYGQAARRSYFTGCSTGGQQGLIEAEAYPDDYDGILVGAPVVSRTWGHAAVLWDFIAANRAPDARLSDAKLSLLNRAALAACGTRGPGLTGDPFVADPLGCRFDPATLACRGAAGDGCLTAPELATARAFYSGPTTRDGRAAYYGWLPGSEAPGRFGWGFLQSPPGGEPAFGSLFKWVFGPGWDWRSFDVDRDMPKVDAALGPALDGVARGDLRAFRARGGKLIVYQGLADTLVAPQQTVAFYERQAQAVGGREAAAGFARLFLAPGMMHCGGGPGPDAFNAASGAPPPLPSPDDDLFLALAQWVETDKAPDRVIATRYDGVGAARTVALQRPLCAYPAKPWLKPGADPRRADSFVCASAEPG